MLVNYINSMKITDLYNTVFYGGVMMLFVSALAASVGLWLNNNLLVNESMVMMVWGAVPVMGSALVRGVVGLATGGSYE